MVKEIKVVEIAGFVGKEVGVSDWVMVDQERIDRFADVTEDDQFIHIDPKRAAAETPFGGTIAHGFLTLSLLPRLGRDVILRLEAVKIGVNYGFDKVRLMRPVLSGRRVRGRFTLMTADERTPGQWAFKYGVKIDIEGEDKPALVAEWLTMQIL